MEMLDNFNVSLSGPGLLHTVFRGQRMVYSRILRLWEQSQYVNFLLMYFLVENQLCNLWSGYLPESLCKYVSYFRKWKNEWHTIPK